MRAVDIDTPAIKRYVAKRQAQGRMNGTINRELAAIKRTFNLAVRCTPPRVPHVPYIPMLKERNVRKGFIEQEAYIALREALPAYLTRADLRLSLGLPAVGDPGIDVASGEPSGRHRAAGAGRLQE